MWAPFTDWSYRPMSTGSDEELSSEKLPALTLVERTQKRTILVALASLLFTTLLGFGVGFAAGAWKPEGFSHEHSLLQPPGTVVREFVYNETFTHGFDDPVAGPAWHELDPNGGKILHPSLAKNETVISAFHQIHCLYVLRLAFYHALDGTFDYDSKNSGDWHAGHCFDYLRQSIMCAADTNLEHSNAEGHHMWNRTHYCRDWESVIAFEVEWAPNSPRNSKRTGL